jgi:hypothetical protein
MLITQSSTNALNVLKHLPNSLINTLMAIVPEQPTVNVMLSQQGVVETCSIKHCMGRLQMRSTIASERVIRKTANVYTTKIGMADLAKRHSKPNA